MKFNLFHLSEKIHGGNSQESVAKQFEKQAGSGQPQNQHLLPHVLRQIIQCPTHCLCHCRFVKKHFVKERWEDWMPQDPPEDWIEK
jgi:hypothetical protein